MDPSLNHELHNAIVQSHSSPMPIVPASSTTRLPNRTTVPVRASTLGSPSELDQKKSNREDVGHARSDDLNHSRFSDTPTVRGTTPPVFLAPSRPMSPASSPSGASSSNHSEGVNGVPGESSKRLSVGSLSSAPSGTGWSKQTSSTSVSNSTTMTSCGACFLPLEGAFVRALGNVWHLQCFKCKDCDVVVASKFFPIEGSDGKQQPLCERDYFRRLNLICGKCSQALRGSYITACNKKYHVEHFTCSVCPTLFGPQDSYYEHEGDVFCHLHYSTRFATKCAGCSSAILKQFVEINRNNRDECWHPECYMINKFWNVKILSRKPPSPSISTADVNEPSWVEEEQRETVSSLKEKQVRMEQQVYRIWTVLSAFEESSAACISDMLRQVSNGDYLEAIRMAEKFILHVEVLFATIDDLETYFSRLNLKGMSHVREARMLCRKTVDLFTLLSHPQESSSRRTGMTQELLALVTGLAHYLKILIRIALTGGLKLEREQAMREAMTSFLDKLHLLAVEGGNPSARRVVRGGEKVSGSQGGAPGTQGVTYGFKSLAPEYAGDSPFGGGGREIGVGGSPSSATAPGRGSVSPPSDLCVKCGTTVEEDCVRLGTYQRWHSHCVQCQTCGKAAAPPPAVKDAAPPKTPGQGGDDKDREKEKEKEKEAAKLAILRRPPANVDGFVYEVESAKESPYGEVPSVIFCVEHGHAGCRGGFQAVSRLEQYAFLLNVALRRLCYLLKRRGLMPASPVATTTPQLREGPAHEAYRDSNDIMRMKSVHLDRKVSATARLPKRSTIIESPTGKIAQPTDVLHSQRVHGQAAQQQGTFVPSRPARPSVPQQQQQQPPRPRLSPPGTLPVSTDERSQVIRPQFTRNNTEVMIVDESAPASPAGGLDEQTRPPLDDDGITLADIPQIIEAEQAREMHRSLPHRPMIAELTPLELMIAKHAAVVALYRSPLKNELDLDEILELVEVKKSGFWNKIFKANKQKKGVFGVPLEILLEKEGADSMLGVSHATLRVPSFIDDVISAMRQMDMSVEGIFRKNGNIRRLNELTEAIDRDPSSVDLTQDNPVQLAALLKKFLKALPEPLMTYKLYRLFMAAENTQNDEERKRYLHLVTLLLPKGNRDTTEVLFVFLKWVASFAHVDEETGNKMDLHNLATVISPNIFRSYSKGNDAVRVESFEGIRVMDSLLEHQDEFYTVPEEFLPILRDQDQFSSLADLPSKDFLKKCDIYMRTKANGRNPGLASPVHSSSPFNMTASGSLTSMGRDGSDPRLASQKSDPALARGRQPDGGRPSAYDRLPSSGSQPFERPALNSIPSENLVRKEHTSSRNQSPHRRLQHQAYSLPLGSPPSSLSQALASPLPRTPNPQQSETDWFTQQQQSSQFPSSRPESHNAYAPRNSGEHSHPNFTPNGHSPAVQLRQRT